jgi:hypothetical protein
MHSGLEQNLKLTPLYIEVATRRKVDIPETGPASVKDGRTFPTMRITDT